MFNIVIYEQLYVQETFVWNRWEKIRKSISLCKVFSEVDFKDKESLGPSKKEIKTCPFSLKTLGENMDGQSFKYVHSIFRTTKSDSMTQNVTPKMPVTWKG